ncbi:MAG: tRNA uridine-5-carboxymethylaminomethyl(34) synthesis GTPase MnmE [Alloprevotella sp.]|nr:tRNA uridine-5-carboxymethylaminomethyl(34) synthesis GTPase MnmE [Alloprevotella sp.]
MSSDTICALATAPGGALGIIRLSGSQSHALAASLCHKSKETFASKPLQFCRVYDGEDVLDEIVATCYHAPHSYTGEDCVELSCHASSYILQRVLYLLTEEGARLAKPGEFTMRAFLAGKMDLSQAESVADLISAQSRAAHHAAISQLRGHFSTKLHELRNKLLHLTTLLELELDFSDHEDLEFADRKELLTLADTIDSHLRGLAASFKAGKAIKEGIPVAIVGETNVGKSTLLNRLVKEERAIVSDIHGTTRDTIEDVANIHGITFRFIDTAGLRQTTDEIEQIGIQRSYEAIRRATIIVWLTDERPSNRQIAEMQELTEGKQLIIVQNKADLNTNHTPWACPMLFISAKHGEGIEALEESIYQAADIPEIKTADIIITSTRHYEALCHARENLARVVSGLRANLSGDLIAEDLRLTLSKLAEITGGQITPQETLNNVFKHFCVGK